MGLGLSTSRLPTRSPCLLLTSCQPFSSPQPEVSFSNQADGLLCCRKPCSGSHCSQRGVILTDVAQGVLTTLVTAPPLASHQAPSSLSCSNAGCLRSDLPAHIRLSSLCRGQAGEVIPLPSICGVWLWPESWEQRWACPIPDPCGSTLLAHPLPARPGLLPVVLWYSGPGSPPPGSPPSVLLSVTAPGRLQ